MQAVIKFDMLSVFAAYQSNWYHAKTAAFFAETLQCTRRAKGGCTGARRVL
jgi:hypothetical protein